MKKILPLLPLLVLAACSSTQNSGSRSTATVYSGAGGGLANVPVTVVNPDGSKITTGNTVYTPAP